MEQKWSKSQTGLLQVVGKMERETGIEPATNSLEGCDSTTELLPQPFESTVFARPRPYYLYC
jgi:hypothetical protein